MIMPALQGCFTGVESTPMITDRDLKRRNVQTAAEAAYLDGVRPQPPRQWQAGKRFRVTDNRIRLIFTPGVEGAAAVMPDSLAGTDITLTGLTTVTGLTGDDQVQLTFSDADGDRLVYRPGLTIQAFNTDSTLTIPFAIDRDLVDSVGARMTGRTFWITALRRFDSCGHQTEGLRYVPVTVTDVRPGNANYPLSVNFVDNAAPADTSHVYMTLGRGATATRNFGTLFSVTDPRLRYPRVTDDTWELIKRSRIRQGMTPDECRLALGAPNEYLKFPSTAGMVERWTYGDGVYLFFEDGVLTRFRR